VLVVQTLRLPRVLVGLLVGAAFCMSGAVTQPVALPAAAMAGGLAVAVLVGALAWRDGVSGPRLVLVGVGVSYVGWSVTHYLLVRGDLTDAQRATVWLAGSLNGRGWEHVRPVALALALLVPRHHVPGQRSPVGHPPGPERVLSQALSCVTFYVRRTSASACSADVGRQR
jgi:ABC-type enterobactin transport system permease subunit